MPNSVQADGEAMPKKETTKSHKTRKREPNALDALSFTALRDGKQLPKPDEKKGQLPRCFWNVTPSGDYAADCDTGSRLAIEFLDCEQRLNGFSILGHIVNDMPRPLTGVEIGFLGLVGAQAMAGNGEARRIRAYWDSCAAADNVRAVK